MIREDDHEAAVAGLRAEHDERLRRIAEWQRRIRGRLDRVEALAEKWENATELDTGNPSPITRAFAAELRAALKDPE
jgi:hypothetical protein